MDDEFQIIYILSDVRSGSTILDLALSQFPKCISVGEMKFLSHHIKKEGVGESWDWKCTCGEKIETCEFWSEILDIYALKFGDRDKLTTDITIGGKVKKSIFFILLNLIGKNPYECDKNRIKNINKAKYINRLYSIINKNKCKIIIDSSKNIDYLYYLYRTNRNIKVLFLLRDGRAVANSKVKWATKFNNGNTSYYQNILAWFLINLKNYLVLVSNEIEYELIDYSKFATNTNKVIQDVTNFKFEEEVKIHSDKCHNIAGTPSRFSFVNEKVVLNKKWKKKINKYSIKNILGLFLNKILNYTIR